MGLNGSVIGLRVAPQTGTTLGNVPASGRAKKDGLMEWCNMVNAKR
jgi:hypothetical protein